MIQLTVRMKTDEFRKRVPRRVSQRVSHAAGLVVTPEGALVVLLTVPVGSPCPS